MAIDQKELWQIVVERYGRGAAVEAIESLRGTLFMTLSTPEMKVLIENAGLFAVGSTPVEFRKFLQHDYDYQTKIINELGIRAS